MDWMQELRQEYKALENCVTAAPDSETAKALPGYVTACWMKIWSRNTLYAPAYAQAVGVVLGQEPTIGQCLTALTCCGEETRTLAVPDFFRQLVQSDTAHGRTDTADFLTRFNHLLVAGACCNGDFTIEESKAVSEILETLADCARRAGLSVDDALALRQPITPLKTESYLQRTSQPDARDSAPEPPQDAAPAGEKRADKTPDSSAPEKFREDPADPAPGNLTTPPEEKSEETLDSLLAELDSLVGLDTVKQDIHSLMNFIKVTKIREARGMKVPTISYHLVFTGNPGTGKTTVARLVAKLYYQMGILPKGQLVEADRSALVAGYLGQTAIKTQKVIQQALGGVLFIDEAYSLANDTQQDSYGKEALETILKAMEDHRNELVVIVAGYDALMHKFIDSNPGLSSRFSKYFQFPDYTSEELLKIFVRFCKNNGYTLEPGTETLLLEKFAALYAAREEHFGNARAIRNIFEKAINCQADRIAGQASFTDADLETLTAADLQNAMKEG